MLTNILNTFSVFFSLVAELYHDLEDSPPDHTTHKWIIKITCVKLLMIGIYFYFLKCLLHFWPVLLPNVAWFYCVWHFHTILFTNGSFVEPRES